MSADTLDKIANYFSTTVDYLLGRTDDPTDYDDGDVLAEIPLSYVEACDGDMRRARALMLAVDEDALNEKGPAPKAEPEIENPDIRMIARAGRKMTPEQAENVRKYAEFMFPEAFKDDDT